MKAAKKIEIITGSIEFKNIIKVFSEHKIPYTAITNISGQGAHGQKSSDEIFGILKNSYLVSTCSIEDWDKMKEEVRKVIKTYGGICMLTDVEVFS